LTKNSGILSNIKILSVNSSAISDITTVRNYSQRPKSFFGSIVDNLKEEFNKNKELKDSVKKFREEAKKLEDSEALREARNKYKEFGSETGRGSQVLKEKFEKIGETLKESEFTKKSVRISVRIL